MVDNIIPCVENWRGYYYPGAAPAARRAQRVAHVFERSALHADAERADDAAFAAAGVVHAAAARKLRECDLALQGAAPGLQALQPRITFTRKSLQSVELLQSIECSSSPSVLQVVSDACA